MLCHPVHLPIFCTGHVPSTNKEFGKKFDSVLVKEICQLLGIRTTPYHPQSDGLVECFNKSDVLNMLSIAVEEDELLKLESSLTNNSTGISNKYP